MLHHLGEEGDEVAGAEVARIHALLLQVAVQVGQQNWDHPVQTVKVQLQHWQFSVEKCAELEIVDDLSHDSKCKSLITQEQIEEPSDEVHSLAVVELGVNYSVCEKNLAQVRVVYTLSESERPLYVLLNLVLYFLG